MRSSGPQAGSHGGTGTWSLPALLILLCKAPFGVVGHQASATCLTPRVAFQLVLASIWVSSLEACLAVSQLPPDELRLSMGQRQTVPGWLPLTRDTDRGVPGDNLLRVADGRPTAPWPFRV